MLPRQTHPARGRESQADEKQEGSGSSYDLTAVASTLLKGTKRRPARSLPRPASGTQPVDQASSLGR